MANSAQAVQQEMQSVADQLSERVPATLRRLKAFHEQTNDTIADAMGLPRHYVPERISGNTGLTLPDLVGFARVFGVTTEVLFMDPVEAVRWSIENEAEPLLRSRCFADGPSAVGTALAAA